MNRLRNSKLSERYKIINRNNRTLLHLCFFLVAFLFLAGQALQAQQGNSMGNVVPDTASVLLQPSSHIFLMPTALPVGGGHGYVADYELFFPYAGVGINDMFSATGGMTLLPGAPIGSQVYTAMLKATLANSDGIAFALAGNFLDISTANSYFHLYSVLTASWDSTWISGALYYRVTGPGGIAVVNAGSIFGSFRYNYSALLGGALGFESPISGRADMRLLGEIWDDDVSNANNIVCMFGVRVRNEYLSADFGFAYVHAPIPVPVMDFVFSW